MKKKTGWYLIAALMLGLALLAVACESSTTPATPAATPPKAPKTIHEAQFTADPPVCTTCHTVGAPGVGVPGGMGLPGAEAGANDHTDRTKATPLQCKTCHQLSA